MKLRTPHTPPPPVDGAETVSLRLPAGRNWRSVFAALLLIASLSATPMVTADDEPTDIDDAREQRDQAKADQAASAARLDALRADFAELEQAVADITAAVDHQQSKVDSSRALLTALQLDLVHKQTAVALSDAELKKLEAEARAFAVEAYVGTSDGDDRTPALLGAENVTDSTRKSSYLDYVNGGNSDVFDRLRQTRSDQLAAAEAAEAAEAERQAVQADLAAELLVLEERKLLQTELQAEMATRVAAEQSVYDGLKDDEDFFTQWIKDETDRQTKLSTAPSPSGFVMPTAGGVGSPFGSRYHPILKINRLHAGVDIGGACGQAIVAAADGEIIFSGWRGGYGNAIVIDHGGGVSSLYAHMQTAGAGPGTIKRGEQIGQVGTTGLSTGCHLHFEIRENGTPVNPMKYLPG